MTMDAEQLLERRQRPHVMGRNGALVADHYLAAAAGYRMALDGGNAVDIAATISFCQNVLEPHQCGIGGEVPILVYVAAERRVFSISGVGWSPAAFTIEWCRDHGIGLIPGDGFLPAIVPGAVGAWCVALERFGTKSLSEVIRPALGLARDGFPMYPGLRDAIVRHEARLRTWPASRALYLPGDSAPAVGELFRSPGLAWTMEQLVAAERRASVSGRPAGLDAARREFYEGRIARRILDYIGDAQVSDASGSRHGCLLDAEDLAEWRAEVEAPVSLRYRGLRVHKCSAWSQGAVFLQQLAILAGFDLPAMGLRSSEYIHTRLEAAQLAFADREAYYGDPRFDQVPFDTLLSDEYAAERRRLVGPEACGDLRPGAVPGHDPIAVHNVEAGNREAMGLPPFGTGAGGGWIGDTTHLDVVDSEGNMVAATPSGGWFPTSPTIPGLGFSLSTRGQMFVLDERRANALAGRKRPRVTLTPGLATRNGAPELAFGMRGGDLQDQLTLGFFVAHHTFGLSLQDALDEPVFWSEGFPSSFHPRPSHPRLARIDERFGEDIADRLRLKGHEVHGLNGLRANHMAVRRDPATGVLSAGVASTGDTSYPLAW